MSNKPAPLFYRVAEIVGDRKANPPVEGLVPICKTTWWNGVKSGLFPKPVKLGPRITVWRSQDILDLANRLSNGGGQ